jgi:hypothetical protein
MTDRPRPTRERAGRTAAATSWLSASVLFAVLLALLGWRMSTGRDPSLGAPTPVAAVAEGPQPRRVLIKRIERRIVVTRVLPPRPAPVSAAPVPSAAYVPPQRAAYVPPQRTAYVPPARPAAPAPAPAPHVVTRAS